MVMSNVLKDCLEKADATKDITERLVLYSDIIKREVEGDEDLKVKEQAILTTGKLLSEQKLAQDLADLIQRTRPFLRQVSKAKAAKLVRTLVDLFLDLEAGTGREVDLCRECIDWANSERRTFLRQALEARLMSLYYECQRYEEALNLGSSLLKELKKLDDKALLVEVQLLESKIYYRLSNLQKSRASLTSARTTANGIYCPTKLQAALDMQSGVLHAADERDFKTAYSYFYEAFEGYDLLDSPKAIDALKYMLLAKIMMSCAEEVSSIITGKLALKYAGRQVEAMREIAQAANKRSLADFLAITEKYGPELRSDPVISKHLNSLYDSLMEQNLVKLIEPYSRVQIDHIAHLISLPLAQVERKLSQMILDRKLHGILDQGTGVLVIFEDRSEDLCYKSSIDCIHNLGKVVDQLYHKAKKLKKRRLFLQKANEKAAKQCRRLTDMFAGVQREKDAAKMYETVEKMVSVIVVAAQTPSVFKVDNSVSVGALICHWSAASNYGQLSLDDVRILDPDGITIEHECPVKDISIEPFGTRIVRVVSNKFVVIHSPAIGDTESKYYKISIFMSCTGVELYKEMSQLTKMKSTEFRLRVVEINGDSGSGNLLLKDVSLESQGITSESRLSVEYASTGAVHCVSRTRTWTRQVPFFNDEPVRKVLEHGISPRNQRVLVDGQVIDVNPELPLKESGMISSEDKLEFTIVFREAIILDMRWSEKMVWVWPEEQVSCLLKYRDDHKEAIVRQNLRKNEELREDNEKSKHEADSLLMSDVNYPDCSVLVKRKSEEIIESTAEDWIWTVPVNDGHSVFYRGFPLDLNATFADVNLPPYALVTINPMEIFLERGAEKTLSAHIPFNASIGDVQNLFPRVQRELYFEKFNLKEAKGLQYSCMTDAASAWRFLHGKTIKFPSVTD